MRVWSVHPALLDRAALVSCWRESLLAQAVLAGRTKGYRAHPQLVRWRALDDPLAGIASYLHGVADEADARGYRFDRTRVDRCPDQGPSSVTVQVTDGQLRYEWDHLRAKVAQRDKAWWARIEHQEPAPHPMMRLVPGEIADWEVR